MEYINAICFVGIAVGDGGRKIGALWFAAPIFDKKHDGVGS
jgi:hypothetical protein